MELQPLEHSQLAARRVPCRSSPYGATALGAFPTDCWPFNHADEGQHCVCFKDTVHFRSRISYFSMWHSSTNRLLDPSLEVPNVPRQAAEQCICFSQDTWSSQKTESCHWEISLHPSLFNSQFNLMCIEYTSPRKCTSRETVSQILVYGLVSKMVISSRN